MTDEPISGLKRCGARFRVSGSSAEPDLRFTNQHYLCEKSANCKLAYQAILRSTSESNGRDNEPFGNIPC